tara:strand:+ start:9584 stop:10015 length:432 start_codon:yes stop_codon:yes gene_type:complete
MYDHKHYSNVPPHTLKTLDNWAKHGLPPGGFVAAVLENDLVDAVRRADSGNSAALVDIVRYLINELPMGCWGSYDNVALWATNRRLDRICARPGCGSICPIDWPYDWCRDCGETAHCRHGQRPHECDDCGVESDRLYEECKQA